MAEYELSHINKYFIEYDIDTILIKDSTGIKEAIYRCSCKMKFDAIKQKIFGEIDHKEIKSISEKLYNELCKIFPDINSYACSFIIDKINECMENKLVKYYLTYSPDNNEYRLHKKKPKKYEGTRGITWQGKGINILGNINGQNSKAYEYCRNIYGSVMPFCAEILQQEYDKIMNLINSEKNQKLNDILEYYISYTPQYNIIHLHNKIISSVTKFDFDTDRYYDTYGYVDVYDKLTYTHRIYPSEQNHSFLKNFYFKDNKCEIKRINKVIYDFIAENYKKYSTNEFERGFYLLTSQTLNNKETNLQINKKENNMTPKNTNEKKSMMSSMMSKFTSQFVPTEENDVKLSMDGNLVVKQGNEYVGIIGDKNELKAYPEEMCFDVPVYSINKPSKDVKVGDIIKRKNSYYKVTSVKDNGVLSLLSFSGNYTSSKEIKDAVLNQSFEKVLINYFNQDSNSGFNPMMFMFMKDSNVDMETIMMMSMMNQNGNTGFNFGNMFGSNSNMNPMMMMLMMKDKGESSMKDMMMLSMMGNMFNQQNKN